MEWLILVLVIIGALCVIASGVWVAIALARVVSSKVPSGTPHGGVLRTAKQKSENEKRKTEF